MNTQLLRSLPLTAFRPSSRIEIPKAELHKPPDPRTVKTLYNAIGRIGFWYAERGFSWDIFPKPLEDEEVVGGELKVSLAKPNVELGQTATLITLHVKDKNGHYGFNKNAVHDWHIPPPSHWDARISKEFDSNTPYSVPAGQRYFMSPKTSMSTVAEIVTGHNFLADALGVPKIPIEASDRREALKSLGLLATSQPENGVLFRTGQ